MRVMNFIKFGVVLLILNSCQSVTSSTSSNLVDSTQVLNLANRESFELPAELDEISGHTFVIGNDDLVYCVQDENGDIFGYNLKDKKIERVIPFAKNGDYEGITNDGTFFYVLKSNGSIFSLPIEGNTNAVKEFKNLLGKGEYESLGIDTVKKELVVICKRCKADHKLQQTTGYILKYNETGEVTLANSFVINLKEASAIDSKFPKVFNPSAITKKVSSGEWYILSSIDKLILVTDANFKPLSIVPFSRKLYEQPEGIAFDSQENLYISSERGDNSSGMLYKIK